MQQQQQQRRFPASSNTPRPGSLRVCASLAAKQSACGPPMQPLGGAKALPRLRPACSPASEALQRRAHGYCVCAARRQAGRLVCSHDHELACRMRRDGDGAQAGRQGVQARGLLHTDRDAFHITRGSRAVLELMTRWIHPGRMRMPNCGHRDDPRMTGRRLEGVCGSEIGWPAVQAAHPLRLARKLLMHRMDCPDIAAEARGCACTRSLESACGKFSRRSTRGFEGRQQTAWRMPRRSWGGDRNSGRNGSAPACCRCDARVRPQQRGCGVLSIKLRLVQRSLAILQQRGGAWGRQADP